MKSMRDDLLVRFSVVSLAALAAVAVSIAAFVSDGTKADAIDEAAYGATIDIQALAVSTLMPSDFGAHIGEERLEALDEFLQPARGTGRIAMVKLWSADGTLMYSSIPEGPQGLDPNPGLFRALGGEVATRVAPASAPHQTVVRRSSLIEAYAPVFFPGINGPRGAFEVYQYYEPTAQRIGEMRSWVSSSRDSGSLPRTEFRSQSFGGPAGPSAGSGPRPPLPMRSWNRR